MKNIRKKIHLIASTTIGGLLLAATMQTGNSFALSNTSPTNPTSPTSTSQQTTDTTNSPTASQSNDETPDPDTTPTAGTDTIASGATTSQTSDNTVDAASATATIPATTPEPDTTSTTPQTTDTQTPTDSQTDTPSNTQTNNTTTNTDVTSTAKSGNAEVEDTTGSGNATSGDASATTTSVNAIASTSDLNSNNLQTFTDNVNGTQNGNITINPSDIVSSTAPSNTTSSSCTPTSTISLNNTTINNLINLFAQSGNTAVSGNGVGGNATSGNATTEADVINLIQDLISNQGSFLGIININGDLNGNILLPESVISSLVSPTSSGNTTPGSTTATNNTTVNNNVSLTAVSGNAATTNNGVGGNATSGNATTILNTCTLINDQITGGNLLLVFVNVMGQWYGALLGEPAGTTSATLGSSNTQDTVIPTSQTSATNNETINNTLNLVSISGNASVTNNGVGGNATTGNATAIADIVNILGSQINLSGWLGVLVINVFGTWNGSLAIQPTTATTTPTGTISSNGDTDTNHTTSSHHTSYGTGYAYYVTNPPENLGQNQYELASAHVLGASTVIANTNSAANSLKQALSPTNHHLTSGSRDLTTDFILAGIGSILAITGGAGRAFANHRKKA